MNEPDLQPDNTPLGRDEERAVFNQMLGQYDAPAYVRRARRVQDAVEQLVEQCRRQRDDWLRLVRVRLALLHALAGDFVALQPWLSELSHLATLRHLHETLAPRLRHAVATTTSSRALRRALGELVESMERFNRRWQSFLSALDLESVNQLRDGYNRYYLLEKECALRSPRAARQGFQRLEPLSVADLAALFPLLPVLEIRL